MSRPIIAITYSSQEFEEFTHWRRMFEGLVEAGAVPLAVDCQAEVPGIDEIIGQVDGLILSGGGDLDPVLYQGDRLDPTLRGVNVARDENELRAWRTARSLGIPVLAICRGAQLLTADLGGDLYMDLPRDRGVLVQHRHSEEVLGTTVHDISVDGSSQLSEWLGGISKISVNSMHHQGIKTLAAGTIEVAHADDGLIEAFEIPNEPIVAVQWHPEVLWKTSNEQLNILKGFVRQAATSAENRLSNSMSPVHALVPTDD